MPVPPRRAAPELPGALRAALAVPDGPPVEMRESHGAWVLLAGDRAYKLKKPVRFAFLDYLTPAARRAACEAEDRVNRELAAPLMLGVRGVRAEDGGVTVCPAGDPRAIDWIVLMRRFDERRTMAGLIAAGALTAEQVRAVAERLAAFHAAAERVADPDPATRVRATIRRNLDELREAAGGERAAALGLGGLESLLLGGLDARARELEARARAGLVRDGHGDLRAEHVLFSEGAVLVIDRIEFDPGLRRIDVADDLSFLAMDLESLGDAHAARHLVECYRAAGGDPGDPALVALFGAHRALVRAKVALLREGGDDGGEPLVALGARLAWRARCPLALLVTGPPASGKSTLARALAARSGLGVLSSDLVRKEQLGLDPAQPASASAYDPAARAAVYAELGRRARAALDAGSGVIVDATCGAPELRRAFLAELGGSHRAHVRAVQCTAPRAVLAARAARPRDSGSDAGPAVAGRLARAFAPITELDAWRVLVIDGTADAAAQVAAVESRLPARAPRRHR